MEQLKESLNYVIERLTPQLKRAVRNGQRRKIEILQTKIQTMADVLRLIDDIENHKKLND